MGVTGIENKVKKFIREHGLSEAHERIKKEYEFYPELRKKMLFILYSNYEFYPFEKKEKLY